MKYIKVILFFLLSLLAISGLKAQNNADYLHYHQDIIKAESLIAQKDYSEALAIYERTFNSYDFVFLRDYKVATQLGLLLKDDVKAFDFMKAGFSSGWTIKGIKKNAFLKPLRSQKEWKHIKANFGQLHDEYSKGLDQSLRAEVHEMFKKDQKMALSALFKFGQKAKVKYNENKFAPHSESQLAKLDSILDSSGYPGEQLIGNNYWASTILSHHNSISPAYNSQDSLYSELRPKLLAALKRGEISPYSFAIIEDWRRAVLSDHGQSSYGILGRIQDEASLKKVNENRAAIGLRSTQLRKALLDIEEESGMDLYLPKGWQSGKISVTD